jgi:hypothetical protein
MIDAIMNFSTWGKFIAFGFILMTIGSAYVMRRTYRWIKEKSPTEASRALRTILLYALLLAIITALSLALGFRLDPKEPFAVFIWWMISQMTIAFTCAEIARVTGKLDMPLARYSIIITAIGVLLFGLNLILFDQPYFALPYAMLCLFASYIAVGQHNARVKAINSAQNLP